jgi:hypothetical protein
MKNVLFIFALASLAACSAEEEIRPSVSRQTVDVNTAKHEIGSPEFSLYLLGADSITFTNIVPAAGLVGEYRYDAVEGTPGAFKNSELFQGAGLAAELLSEGRHEIRAFTPGVSIDFTYDVTYRDGKRVVGSYNGKISPL